LGVLGLTTARGEGCSLRTALNRGGTALASLGPLRYSPGKPVPGVVGMTAIYTIIVFLLVFAGLNFFEFGRID
jgi:hypothetical protein